MRTAAYGRVSTQRQSQAQTIDQQWARLRAHLAAQGEELHSAQIFRDDGYSGASLNRPGLDHLRDAVRAAAFDRVLVTTPDRLARHYLHQMVLLEELERLGCRVEFLERPMSQDPHDQLLLQIRSAVAEYERTLIAERMRRGRQMKLRAGILLPWATTPYGYRVDPERPRDPGGVRIDPAEGAIVRELFTRYLEAPETIRGLVKYLLGLGLPSPRGRIRWSAASVRGILTNPTYTGQVYSGRKRMRPARARRSATHPIGQLAQGWDAVPPEAWQLVVTVPAVVSEEQFKQVQAKLALNQQFASRNNKTHTYLLRALVSCGVCQACCLARTTNGGLRYYVCRTKTVPRYGQPRPPCRSRHIPAQQLEDLVWQDLCALLRHPDQMAYALERAHGRHWLPQELQARQEALRKGRANLETQMDRLTQAYLAAMIPLEEYQRRRRSLEEKIQALEAQITQLEAQVDRRAEVAGLTSSIDAFCQRVQAMGRLIGYARVSTAAQDLSLQLEALRQAGCRHEQIFCETLSLVTVIEALLRRQVGFRSLCDGGLDTTTASGELVFHIFSALAQFERRLIQERTCAGLAAARARGKKGGRKPVQPEEPRVRMAFRMYGDPRLTVADICQTLRISPATFYRYITLGRRTADSE
jgi:site-specific DNA recombinase